MEATIAGCKTNKTDFDAYIADGEWLFDFRTNANFPQFTSSQIGCDGTNMYVLNYIRRDYFDPNSKIKDLVLGNGYAKFDAFPAFDHYRTAQLWLAFCYRFYKTNWQQKLPCSLIHPQVGGCNYIQARISLMQGDTNCVAFAETYAEGTTTLTSGKKVNLPAPYQNGYKNGRFVVLEYTNYNGINLPTLFKFDTFYMKPGAHSSNELELVYSLYGHVKSIRNNSETFLPPRITTRTFVRDYRVPNDAGIDDIRYYTTNKWKAPGQSAFSKNIENEVAIQKRQPFKPEVVENYGKVIIIILLLNLPIIFWIMRRHFKIKSHS